MSLNKEQQLAVEHVNGPLLVLAGAGSGKTRVLTERVVHLIKNNHCRPWQILAVTFTNKAAQEMKTRIEKRIGPVAREVWINTFHSACLKILRRHAEQVNLDPHFAILDEADQLSLIKKVLAELNISDKILSPKSAVEKISRAKDSCIIAKDYPDGDFYHEKIAAAYRGYEKQKLGAVDFGDLIMLATILFRTKPEILAHYQERFRYVLIDEYQDTNHAQYELVRQLVDKHKNICAVGDPDQSVYAWRGADIGNILEFEHDFEGAAVIKLEQNYRSTKNILAASDAVIANNKSRKPKTLWTENEDGCKVNIIETKNERKEAAEVVSKIKEITKDGGKLKDIAIFYRTNAQSRSFEDELRREGLPYAIYGGIRFYDRAEVKNAVAYLRLIRNPSDDISLKRVINAPIRGIGKTTVEKLETCSKLANTSICDFIATRLDTADLNSGVRQRLSVFTKLIKDLRALASLPLPQLVSEAITKTGYIQALEKENTEDSDDRIANLDELVSAVSEACKQSPELTLSDFLDQVALISSIDRYDYDTDFIPLMTLHLAKGLEFSNVFIVGLEEGVLPHIRAVDDLKELEEERRLFYVGMTRAKKALYICHANERLIRGNYNYNVPSRFLEEIPEKLVNRLFAHCPSSFHGETNDDFNQISYTDLQVAGFKTGQRVIHPTFGEGIVRKTEGHADQQRLIIQFKSGELKRLSAKYANLIPV
ncbi:MAG: hypothetical protein A3I09_04700 [Deltaproteobacteria bacterium RIFCSPLOWO2_02_FULL_47_10]|nr:MAG: hypothetical protein A3I09_04700 [Deltaproteobacteria bacterium RIFCSPLOWO2_02_FULL_47_10]